MDYLFVDRIIRPGGIPEGARMLCDVRLEGDDTAIGEEDAAWFEISRDCARIGIEADVPMRALLFADPPEPGSRAS